jgi:hypothetical protein
MGGSHLGGAAMAVVRNAPVRAAVARSPAWTRGGSLGRARRRVRGEKRKGGRGAAVGPFEAEVARQRRGVRGWSPHGGRKRGRERGGRARRGTARRHDNGPATARAGGTAWPRRAAGRTNMGGAEELTGGPRPQCRVAAPTDRRARALHCACFNSV